MKQTRKSKSNRKKTTRTKSTRTKSRTRRNKRMMKGGNPKIESELNTAYDTIFDYLLELLNQPDFKTKVFEKNREFIHSISINNDNFSETFNYENNVEFRKFIDDSLQWLLFDYNPYIFNTLLTVIYNCFIPLPIENAQSASSSSLITAPKGDVLNKQNSKFLEDNVDSFQILFDNLQIMILQRMKENFNAIDDDKKNEIKLLTLILYVLTIPSVTTAVSNFIKDNKVLLKINSSNITCVINKIKEIDIKKNKMVRELITKYFESLKIDRSDINYTELLTLLGKFGECIRVLLSNLAGKYLVLTGKSVGNLTNTYVIKPFQQAMERVSHATSNIPTTVFGRLPFPQ
jgi:hypothetical protein